MSLAAPQKTENSAAEFFQGVASLQQQCVPLISKKHVANIKQRKIERRQKNDYGERGNAYDLNHRQDDAGPN